MTHEEIIIELNIELYTMKKEYKELKEESEKHTRWWLEVTKHRDELIAEIKELKEKPNFDQVV